MILILKIASWLLAASNALLMVSDINKKRKGDKGYPCLIPLMFLKKLTRMPFTRIEKQGVGIQDKIKLHHLLPN